MTESTSPVEVMDLQAATVTARRWLEAGDLATAKGLRVSHVVRRVDGLVALTLCKEIALWAALSSADGREGRVASTSELPMPRTCRTCSRRADARAAGQSRS